MPEPAVDVERLAVAFARVVRGLGIDVPIGATAEFARALGCVGVGDRSPVYWAGRATLVKRPEEIAPYDRAFDAFWLGRTAGTEVADAAEVVLAVDAPGPAPTGADDVEVDSPVLTVRWSALEVLRHRDFASFSAAEHEEARRLMGDLRVASARRRSRRLRPTARSAGSPDARRTVRAALRTGGEPIRRRFRVPAERPRRIVFLLDVSGSMEPYARMFLRLLHAAVAGRGRVDAFAFGTRLTRITRELSSHDPDAALRAAAGRIVDWSGGTRLGEGLRTFNDTWGVRGMARGAVVVVLSDGWDRGDPAVVGEQMARLARVAHRIVWVNPLKATPGYAPLAGGMAAALPYVDTFVEGNSLAALDELVEVIAR